MNGSEQGNGFWDRFGHTQIKRATAFGIIIIVALLAFELFNYSTTDFALRDLLGELRFLGLRWATILSIAFCGIDFAGIARLFTPEQGSREPTEVWYLFGAWLLAATMNAILTWWGVSMAIINHQVQSTSVLDAGTLVKVVPIFVAVMVWLIRILIIGSLSYAGDHMFAQPELRPRTTSNLRQRTMPGINAPMPTTNLSASATAPRPTNSFRPTPKPVTRPETGVMRPEPTYHSMSMRSRSGMETAEPGNPPQVTRR